MNETSPNPNAEAGELQQAASELAEATAPNLVTSLHEQSLFADKSGQEENHRTVSALILESIPLIAEGNTEDAEVFTAIAEYHKRCADAIQRGHAQPLRPDGPSYDDWVESGRSSETYPPAGYAARGMPPGSPTVETDTVETNGGKVYFKKVMISTPFFWAKKQKSVFEALGQNTGVKVLTIGVDDAEIEGLTKASKANGGKGTGGIVRIDEAAYLDLKKNLPYQTPANKREKKLRVWQPNARRSPRVADRVAGAPGPVKPSSAANTAPGKPAEGSAVGQRAGTAALHNFAPRIGGKKMPQTRLPSTGKLRADVIPSPPTLP